MRGSRAVLLLVVLVAAALAAWLVITHSRPSGPGSLTVYYTKLDGSTLGTWNVSVRAPEPGESDVEHLHNEVLYAAVQALAGPPADVQCVRFPPGTHVLAASVSHAIATIDLSKDVTQQVGGSFAENGAFKGLVYTVTGVPGIDAVQVTIAGARVDTLPGGHLELDQPLRRSDW